MKFTVTGHTDMGRKTQPFELEVDASSESHAREKIYSRFGSKHHLSRANVHIESLQEA